MTINDTADAGVQPNPISNPSLFYPVVPGDYCRANDLIWMDYSNKSHRWEKVAKCLVGDMIGHDDPSIIYRRKFVDPNGSATIKILSAKIIQLMEELRTRKNREKALLKGMDNLLEGSNKSEQKQYTKGEMIGTLEVIRDRVENLFK